MTRKSRYVLAILATLLPGPLVAQSDAPAPVRSALWGQAGELWSPDGRLPDFSFAGYRRGEASIPTHKVAHNVREFGALGDGENDDSDAFLDAIAAAESGVILVPEGRYIITKMLLIDKPNLVLRGEGPEKTILYFPTPLNEIKPNWGATTGGRRTSNYSWSGGFISIRGSYRGDRLTGISAPARRGTSAISVNDPSALSIGQDVEVRMKDDGEDSLAMHLYSGDPRIGIEKLNSRTRASIVARITSIDGTTITLDRTLRFDIRPEWQPALHRFAPTVTECGIEGMRFDYPNTPYGGHFTEVGFNAFAISQASHCWVRNVHIHNADSGGFVSGYFNTVDDIVWTSDRKKDSSRKATGHHGIILGDDNLCTNFDFRCKFVHDVTVSGSAGSVYSNGRGVSMSFDHHRRAPYENLFTNIDTGSGEEVWRCGGGAALGAHCGARGTFWNIRADKPMPAPGKNFGPWSMNFVGVKMNVPDDTDMDGRWFEHVRRGQVLPKNLHEAQLERRLRETKPE
jgi:hypothetical protein